MIKYPHIKKNAQQFFNPVAPILSCKKQPYWVFLRSKKFALCFFVPCNTHLLSILMLLRFAQVLCGLLACVMCIFILGPVAILIESGRIVRSAVRLEPIEWSRWLQLLPQFILCCGLVAMIAWLI
jgi:hypothetical protein